MIFLSVYQLSMSLGFGRLFNNVSFNLNKGDVLGIVGPNGCGKSTLLKIIAGEISPTSGSVSIKKGTTISFLKQQHIQTDMNCKDFIKLNLNKYSELEKLIKKYEKLLENNSNDKNYNKYVEKYCELLEEYNNQGGYELDARINEILDGLHINQSILSQPFYNLSGGEKTLICLTKCLIENPNIFLLDEPTNHLDLNRIEWLENYIKKFDGAIILVSHDRYLLSSLTTKILDLSDIDAKLYNVNYTDYLIEKEKDFERQMIDYKNAQRQIKKLQMEARYFLQKAHETGSPLMYNRAKQMRNKVLKLKEIGVKKNTKQIKKKILFNEEYKRSNIVISIEKLYVVNSNNKYILNNIDLNIKYGDRVAFIGGNGSGKTTLINSIVKNQKLKQSGNIIIGQSTIIGYLPQIIVFDKPKLNIIEYFQKETGKDIEATRRILSNFNFDEDVVKKRISNLSEGEKIRLKLSIILQNPINCLIFDEPTNHIDIETKENLENAINCFEGTFIFVSHDRFFINKFANKIIEFKDGTITEYDGNYDYYKEQCEKKF